MFHYFCATLYTCSCECRQHAMSDCLLLCEFRMSKKHLEEIQEEDEDNGDDHDEDSLKYLLFAYLLCVLYYSLSFLIRTNHSISVSITIFIVTELSYRQSKCPVPGKLFVSYIARRCRLQRWVKVYNNGCGASPVSIQGYLICCSGRQAGSSRRLMLKTDVTTLYTVSGKNGTNNVLRITLTKFNKFPQFLAQFIMLTCQLTKKI